MVTEALQHAVEQAEIVVQEMRFLLLEDVVVDQVHWDIE